MPSAVKLLEIGSADVPKSLIRLRLGSNLIKLSATYLQAKGPFKKYVLN